MIPFKKNINNFHVSTYPFIKELITSEYETFPETKFQ